MHTNTFAYGKVNNGVIQFTSTSVGGNPTIASGNWYNLKIEVSATKAVKLFLDNVQIGSFKAFWSTRGYGGLIVANGYANLVFFRDFDVSPIVG